MYVHEHHVGLESRRKEDSLLAVDGFSDDTEVVIAVDYFTQKLPNERMIIHEKNLYWLRMRRLTFFVVHAGAPIRFAYQEKCTGKDAPVLVNQGIATEKATVWSRLLSQNESNEASLKAEKLLVDAYAERGGQSCRFVAGHSRDDNGTLRIL